MISQSDMRKGLEDMVNLTGITKQISRCLDFSYQNVPDGRLWEILLQLQKTVEVLNIGRSIKNTGIPLEGGAALLLNNGDIELTWVGWFKIPQWGILQQFVNSTPLGLEDELDFMIKSFQDMLDRTKANMMGNYSPRGDTA